MNFLFWNVGKQASDEQIASVVLSVQANIIALAEYAGLTDELAAKLSAFGHRYDALPNIGCPRIHILTDISGSAFQIKRESEYFSIREFAKAGQLPLLLAFVHLPSKRYLKPSDQVQEATLFRRDLELVEQEAKNANTVIIGDFNMDPFDPGMVSAAALHSISDLSTSSRKPRLIRSQQYSFFYNPSWNLLGDMDGPPGTSFYQSPSYEAYYWHLLDQVVLRPSVAKRLDNKSLRILTSANGTSLVDKNGRPSVSDHLPLSFSLDLSPRSAL